jgi:hypothetical protein
MTPCVLGADRAEARERARRRLELEGSDEDPEAAARPPSWIAGTVEQAAAKIAATEKPASSA